ncbi:MAG: hypothetical protein U0325_30540 [Polyangiales bacterium]
MKPSSSVTADHLRNLLTLQRAVGVGAVVCPVITAVVVLSDPDIIPLTMDSTVMLVAFVFVAGSLGLDALVAERMRSLRGHGRR